MKNYIEKEKKYRQISKFKKFRIKKEFKKTREDVPEVPQKLKQVYEHVQEEAQTAQDQNNNPERENTQMSHRPRRFKKELDIQKVNIEEKSRKEQEQKEKEKKKKQNKRERINTNKLLSKTNQKGQPRLNNVMKHVYGKLGLKL